MMFPKVLILTLLILGTIAKGSIQNMEERMEALENLEGRIKAFENMEKRIEAFENMEERFEALERKLATCTMADQTEDIGTNRGLSTMANFVSLNYFFLLKS